MHLPLISIIVPCYNQAQYLEECLQSILDQTYENWECIIINDGSPDNTNEIAKKWTEQDCRFNYLLKENGGLSSARNAGIKIAEGEWILPLDADDKIGKQYLEFASEQFDNDFKIIYCDAEYFGDRKGVWQLRDYSIKELAKNNMIFCTAFFKKDDWQNVGGYDESIRSGYEDWDFWISLLKAGGEVMRLNGTYFFYRIKENSMTADLHADSYRINKVLIYLLNKHIEFFSKFAPDIHFDILQSSFQRKKILILEDNYKRLIGSRRYRIGDAVISKIDYLKSLFKK